MRYKIRCIMLREIAVRMGLWLLFVYFDHAEPFMREIHQNEIWKYQYPEVKSYVPNVWLWAILTWVPTLIFLTDYSLNENREGPLSGVLGITLSYSLTGVMTAFLKTITGRPRPDFYFKCFPGGSGTDYYSCTGAKKSYLDGRKSFPSGHASFSFACMTFISLYFGERVRLFQDSRRGEAWKLCVCLAPLMFATAVAVSRTCDYHHHFEDVAAGSLMGAVNSYLCYKLYFPKKSVTVVEVTQ